MTFPIHDGAIALEWERLSGDKGDVVSRSETYGQWTIPTITADPTITNESAQEKGHVVVGARLVNHLSNRIADTMFPHGNPFFMLALTPEAKLALAKEVGEEGAGKLADIVRSSTARIEEVAMRKLKMTSYRPMAVLALKHLIIAGNCVIKRQKDETRIVYGVRDFCIARGVQGDMRHCILKDNKKFGNLPEDVKAAMLLVRPDYQEDTDVVLLSNYKLKGKRWEFTQAADNVTLAAPKFFNDKDLPILPLTWTLARGEDYGHGLVEDNAIAFHNLDVLTAAMIDLMSAIADIKFLVRPGSQLDVAEMNAAPRGSYHQGNEGDITIPDIGKRGDIQVMLEAIAKWERDLSQAFLLNSASTRDAERVTAEEIRLNARELESAYGGLYSRLAEEWQFREGTYAINKVDFKAELGANAKLFEVLVVTGLESLSREGQLDNLRLAIGDMQMLDQVPEELRATINPLLFASFIFTNRRVQLNEFMFTADQIKANQAAAMQQQRDVLNAEAEAKVVQAGGEAAVAQP